MAERLRRIIRLLKRAMRIQRRLTLEEFYLLLQLSEAIVDHGRMVQSYYTRPLEPVMVEITELAFRFREEPQTIEDALLLLKDTGRADPYDRYGRWILRLGNALDGQEKVDAA
jgi:hypothetical protein